MRVGLEFLKVGSCRHPACMVTGKWGREIATFPAIVGLIKHPERGNILFDTGYGQALDHSTDPVAKLYRRVLPYQLAPGEACVHQLAAAGIQAGDVHAIILSHMHPDHAGGLKDFPDAAIYLTQGSFDSLRTERFTARCRQALIRDLFPEDLEKRAVIIDHGRTKNPGKAWAPFGDAVDLFGDGTVMAFNLPGHAVGQIGIKLRDEHDRDFALIADAAWQAVSYEELLEPLLPVRRLLDDYDSYLKTLHNLHDLWRRETDLTIVPSHCQRTLNKLRHDAD